MATSKRLKRSDIPEADIVEACNRFHAGLAETPEKALANKYPPKLVLAKMEQLVQKGILDYGVSLRTAWVKAAIKWRVGE